MSSVHLVYLIPVVLVTCFQHTHVFATQFQDPDNESYFRNFPCPNAEDIDPCLCTYHEDEGVMDMNCTNIADEQQLYNIFHSDIPVPTFRLLTLGTNHLEQLSDTVFGDATFEVVWTIAVESTLTTVDPKTFIKSASTLKVLSLMYNELSDFPFETLSQYTQLAVVDFFFNPLSSFPIIQSETLSVLDLGYTAFNTIPAGALDGLPNLGWFGTEETKLDSMPTGLFTSLPKITHIDLSYTQLEHLESLQFEVNSDVISYISLHSNKIATVDADAFRGVQSGRIDMRDNKLTILPQATWKPVIDAGVHLSLEGNALTCGCDVAWLVLEPTYHYLVEDAICYGGEMLVDLDPSDFENCNK